MKTKKTEFGFELLKKDVKTKARLGIVRTPRGGINTPAFMPVGTQATVKTFTPRELEELGAEIILSNAYHLYIRPGIDIIRRAGGLHSFMAWNKPILTDSGGYQVFSLAKLRKVTPEGAIFNSHFDGREIRFTPELVVEIQEILGSDIAMVFDECPPFTENKAQVAKSMEITLAWAKRAKACHTLKSQALFGIVQGGFFTDLRKESLERTVEIGFDGYALGGFGIGEPEGKMDEVLAEIGPAMPEKAPRYLMGIGTPLDILDAVSMGMDMFDCVIPTREARHGRLYLPSAKGYLAINVKSRKFASDSSMINAKSALKELRRYSKAYLRHLFSVNEPLALRLATLNNLEFYLKLMSSIRREIKLNKF